MSNISVREYDGQRWYKTPLGEFPSCTTVINQIYGPPFPPEAEAAAEHARDRGKEVHRAIELFCSNDSSVTLDWESLDPEVRTRMDHFYEWQHSWMPRYVEIPFYSGVGFGCTPDQVGYKTGDTDISVLEIKPRIAKTVGLQTAAQAIAVKECLRLDYVPGRIALHLSDDGCREVELDKYSRDRDAFMAALYCFNYGTERRIWQ